MRARKENCVESGKGELSLEWDRRIESSGKFKLKWEIQINLQANYKFKELIYKLIINIKE